jgi:NAD(P)-dependent dehydrogenase (short-subunit alcohol dehydrogenase family)
MKTVLITGANRGIGLEHARQYASRGVRVFATARAPDQADDLQSLAAKHADRVTIVPYDAEDDAAAATLKRAVGDAPLDLLFANAGTMGGRGQSFGAIDEEHVIELFRINALAPLKLAEAFADNVARSERKEWLRRLLRLQAVESGAQHGGERRLGRFETPRRHRGRAASRLGADRYGRRDGAGAGRTLRARRTRTPRRADARAQRPVLQL